MGFVNVFYSIVASIYALQLLKAISSCCQFQDKAAFKSLDFNIWSTGGERCKYLNFRYTLYHNLLMAVSYGDSVLHEGDR